jgi:hypothetical protein
MTISDIKILVINFSTFAISLSHIDMLLKIVLLITSILYTMHKWYLLNKNKNKNK